MATINIGQSNAGDQFYRYKMPRLQAKVSLPLYDWRPTAARLESLLVSFGACFQVEGRGNGIKTCVVNNVEIAKALERPPECKLACLAVVTSSD